MPDTSRSRRLTGRAMLAVGILTLPLTASISYAAAKDTIALAPQPSAPPAPPAPQVPGDTPPVPPAWPTQVVAPPSPPAPPAPPREASVIQIIDPDRSEEREEWRETRQERREERLEARQEQAERRALAMALEEAQREHDEIAKESTEQAMKEMERSFAEAERALEDLPRAIDAAMKSAHGGEGRTVVKMKCDRSSTEVASTVSGPDGSQVVLLCERRIMVQAMKGLREAREAIAENARMPSEQRKRVIEQIDRQIERWENRDG